jgi:alkylation response protein AidB-like acyl-CoA dehydrogenase
MPDFELTDEQEMLRATAREFARKEIASLVDRLRRERAQGVEREPWPLCRDLYHKGWELGFTRMLLPRTAGGGGLRMLDAVLLLEELGAADVAIAADLFALNMTVPLILIKGASEEQQRQLLPLIADSPTVLAGALSEPNVAGSELFTQDPDPRMGIKTFARREGDDYVLTGQKSAFVTNGAIADYYLVLARTSLERPLWESISIFFVSGQSPGLKRGARTRLAGWHAGNHGELLLEEVRVPQRQRIGGEGEGARIMGSLPEMGIGLAAAFVGLARNAYEYALDYAGKRHSMGVPIARHQAVALKLADMYCDYRAAQLAVWHAAAMTDSQPMRAATLEAPFCKTLAVDAAIRNAERATQILGAYGVTQEYPTAAWLADAWIGYSCDFTRDMLRLGMVPFLPTTP